MSKKLVILLHGVGGHGLEMTPLSERWKSALPNTTFATPDAPDIFDLGPIGHQWFSVKDVTPKNRGARVKAARKSFDQTISAIIDLHGMTGRLQNVAFAGFSQGSIMALDAVARGRWPVGAMLAYSGRLATPAPYDPCCDTPVLLIHGREDNVIPVEESIRAHALLRDMGFAAELVLEENTGHTVSLNGTNLGRDFLKQNLFP